MIATKWDCLSRNSVSALIPSASSSRDLASLPFTCTPSPTFQDAEYRGSGVSTSLRPTHHENHQLMPCQRRCVWLDNRSATFQERLLQGHRYCKAYAG